MAHTINKYQYRFLARIVIEAQTPLAVGSGEKDIITDSLVARDVNGLPYIPGTAIAGILRHAIGEENAKTFFGYSGKKKNSGRGSEIIFSSAQIVDEDGTIVEGLIDSKSTYLQNFDELPVRQHTRINEKGTADAENHGKFDEQVVFKGSRFCFEMELLSNEKDESNFTRVLSELAKDTIRIGSGTRKGFGKIEIVECRRLNFCLEQNIQQDSNDSQNYLGLDKYIEKTSSLNDSIWKNADCVLISKNEIEKIILSLTLKDFLLIGSGQGSEDTDADSAPVNENVIFWNKDMTYKEIKKFYLIPATSLKGALAHRVAFYYNKGHNVFLENLDVNSIPDLYKKGYKIPTSFNSNNFDHLAKLVTLGNPAVLELFGYANTDKKVENVRGNVLVSDVFIPASQTGLEIQPHVVIDSFTGGAAKGKLFQEQLLKIDVPVKIEILVISKSYSPQVREALDSAIDDLKSGALALGAATNRGHGTFVQTSKK
ncbi:MAG: RAMP superfamily CRISPR-associated protein [Prevotella sp.]|jgi:CRISPR/Cas system CSM-associated protein Csm3 (group 7 of RAMP superfamily)|nr:RAMP superfamily CRISPR-associated protein [Prevotella sp.]